MLNENKLLEAVHHAVAIRGSRGSLFPRLLLLWSRQAQVLSPLFWRNSSHRCERSSVSFVT